MGGSEVHADALSGPRGRVEEGEIVCHARPHAGGDDTQQEAEKLDTPGILDGGEADSNDTDGEDDAGHPGTGTESAHDKVGRQVEEHIRDVEQGQGRRRVLGREAEYGDEIMFDVPVHGLRNADVGPDGRAEKVEGPKGRNDAKVKFPRDVLVKYLSIR